MEASALSFLLKKLLASLLLPPLLPMLPLLAGLLLWRRRPRLGRLLSWTGVVLNLLLITPASVSWLLAAVEDPAPLAEPAASTAAAIVILGAGRRSYAPEFGGETVNRLALERLRYGARLARRSGLPVLVSGGSPDDRPAEALLMKAALEEDFGIPVRWTETASRDTRENARNSVPILHAAGIERILLVTHAAHMGRAQAEFAAAGIDVLPAPTGWLGNYHPPQPSSLLTAPLPSQASAYGAWFAVHELLGQLAYRFSR